MPQIGVAPPIKLARGFPKLEQPSILPGLGLGEKCLDIVFPLINHVRPRLENFVL